MNSEITYSVQAGNVSTMRSVKAAGMVFTKGEVLPQLAKIRVFVWMCYGRFMRMRSC